MSIRSNTFMRLASRPAAGFGLAVLTIVIVSAAVAPLIYPDDPMGMVAVPLVPPLTEPGLPLGSDQMGRDLAAGLFHGARISLMVGLCSAAAASLIGALIGGIAGYFGGMVDNVSMRITEVFQTIPGFILAIVLVVLIGPSIGAIIFAIAVVSWPPIARLTRAEFLSALARFRAVLHRRRHE